MGGVRRFAAGVLTLAGAAWAEPSMLRRGGRAGELRSREPVETPVDCKIEEQDQRLLLLTSSGLGSYGPNETIVPSPALQRTFRDLVLRLPPKAWAEGGEAAKLGAEARDPEARRFAEPELYDKLDVVIVEDSCFLKESMWNAENPDFNIKSGIGLNHVIANFTTDVELVRPFFGHLDGSWCVNWASDAPGYLGWMGFDKHRLHHLSLWDLLAPDELKAKIFDIREYPNLATASLTAAQRARAEQVEHVRRLLDDADVVIVNGGNPDFVNYVLREYAAEITAQIRARVLEGSLIYVGQSAGSMAGGADAGITIEMGPAMVRELLGGSTKGVGLAGRCAIRPHDGGEAGGKYDLVAAVHGVLQEIDVVRLQNGDALRCIGASCHVVGNSGRPGASLFDGPYDPHLQRLAEAFRCKASGCLTNFV